ncbi:hypothetical protein [Candidatus Palauibacter sp.]|uniref:hypothetical protein n=1 Tax=Candidatus Palauibacter sp. TaxID=3101350 RepID=UPI003B519BBD
MRAPRDLTRTRGFQPVFQPRDGTGLLYDPRYLDHVLIRPDGGRLPETPERLVRIREELVARGLGQRKPSGSYSIVNVDLT